MDSKEDELCLDKCDVLPKLIQEKKIKAQHYAHDRQPIEQIYQRLEEPVNLNIVNEFLQECSLDKCNLDSMMSQYEILKNKIKKQFEQDLEQFFKKIYRIQTQDWKENNRRERTIRSIIPNYIQEYLSQIEGSFEFLKQEQLVDLQIRALNQKERDIKAKNLIDLLVSKTENLFKNYIEWEQDGQQEKRLQMIEKSKTFMNYEFAKNRILRVEGICEDNINKTINLINDFNPDGLIIKLKYELIHLQRNNELSDISPLSEFKALVNLNSLDIQLYYNQLSDISPLSELKALVNLTSMIIQLNNNQLRDISPLSEFKALINLTILKINLSVNQLSDISPLSEFKALVNLTSLDINLWNNKLSDISPLSEFKSLVNLTNLKFDLSNNQLCDISPLKEFKDLVNLTSLAINLYGNQLSDISPLSEFKALVYLTSLEINLGNNQLGDISPLSDFKALVNLTSLDIYLYYNLKLPSVLQTQFSNIHLLLDKLNCRQFLYQLG